jgi:hypothetical protein
MTAEGKGGRRHKGCDTGRSTYNLVRVFETRIARITTNFIRLELTVSSFRVN